MSKPDELKVFTSSRNSTCQECNEDLTSPNCDPKSGKNVANQLSELASADATAVTS